MHTEIPDCPALVRAVMDAASNRDSLVHGPAHWRCVAWTGWELIEHQPNVDRATAFLFGLLHDAMRLSDGTDPQHGPRAAVLARRLNGTAFFLDDARLEVLCYACDHHTHGKLSADPTIGVCWDADRLNLWRIGVRPDVQFLSTERAKIPEVIRAASRLEGQQFDWETIYAAYGKLR
jgi:uncharacterized protein